MRIERGTHNMAESIRECFASDPALTAKWHIAAPGTVDECVNRTMQDIETTFDLNSFRFYRAYSGDELIGYWGTEFGQYVNLIFLKPSYRTTEYREKIWSEIEKTVAPKFYTAVYSKNLPAVKFYSARGTKIAECCLKSNNVTMFEFVKKDRC